MILVTSAGCNPVFRVPVTCGYPAERGYFVSKKAFLSKNNADFDKKSAFRMLTKSPRLEAVEKTCKARRQA